MRISLAHRRKQTGRTQLQVAKMTGYSKSAIGMIEIGKATPPINKLPVLAEAYGCTVEELLADLQTPMESGTN